MFQIKSNDSINLLYLKSTTVHWLIYMEKVHITLAPTNIPPNKKRITRKYKNKNKLLYQKSCLFFVVDKSYMLSTIMATEQGIFQIMMKLSYNV